MTWSVNYSLNKSTVLCHLFSYFNILSIEFHKQNNDRFIFKRAPSDRESTAHLVNNVSNVTYTKISLNELDTRLPACMLLTLLPNLTAIFPIHFERQIKIMATSSSGSGIRVYPYYLWITIMNCAPHNSYCKMVN